MRKNIIGEAKGIMISDAIVAVLIILIFAGTLTSLIYNIILETLKTKIYSQQMDIATEVFEHIETMNYNDVNTQNICNYINSTYASKNISANSDIELLNTKYKIGVTVTPYNNLEGNSDKYDIIKIIKLDIKYHEANTNCETEISRIKKASVSEVQNMF